jgi:hypothetical protein
MADDKKAPIMTRFFHTCLLILGGVFGLWLAVSLIQQIWLWLVLLGSIALLITATLWFIRWRRDRRW